MNSKLKIVVAALMLGTATVAAAQTTTRAQLFADQLAQMQRLSASTASTYAYKPAPEISRVAQDPVGKQTFARSFATLQAESSNSSEFEAKPVLSASAADPVGNVSFAQKFAWLQAASSDSGQFGFRPGSNVPADEANSTLVAGKALPLHVATRK